MSESSQDIPKTLGRYEIVGVLGKGAMGVVYDGRDPNIGRRVAIKTARRDVLESSGRADEMMERFLREARAAGTLNHPNIITIYDVGEEQGTAYIAMEFIEGTDLQKLLQKNRRFTAEEVVDLCATVCDALHNAHGKGVVHRDVKPANIMILDDGAIRIADFGIAWMSDSSLTQEGSLLGTPHYMSPEQFMGQRVDGRSDLFSVGIISYELLTGERPFLGEALSTVMHNVIKAAPIAPRELNFSVNPTLNQVVLKALSKDPNERYQTGAEMAAALRESLKPQPDPAVLQFAAPANPALDATITHPPSDEAATVVMERTLFERGEQGGTQSRASTARDTAATIVADGATPQQEAPAAASPQATSGPSPRTLLIGAVAVLAVVLVAAAGFGLMRGGGAVDTVETTFQVWIAKSGEALNHYSDYGNLMAPPSEHYRPVPADAGVELELIHPDTEDRLGRKKVAGSTIMFDIPADLSRFRFNLYGPDGEKLDFGEIQVRHAPGEAPKFVLDPADL